MSKEEKKESPYQILNKWLNDKSKLSPIPQELIEDKVIGPQYILYYFQSSPYILYLNDLFNNYSIYQMNKIDMFKMMKDICLKISFRPKYISNSKEKNTQIYKCLKEKYPYLKKWEIGYLERLIDTLDIKDNIYESFGLIKPKKQKSSTREVKVENKKEQQEENWTLDKLMSNFN